MITGANSTDWEKSALKDFGRVIKLNRVTIVLSNMSADQTRTYGGDEVINAVFSGDIDPKYSRGEEGVYEYVEPFIQAKISDNVKRYDKITIDAGLATQVEFYIDSTESVKLPFSGGDTALFTHCPLKRVG